jgi:hypothetical protein
VNRCAGYQYRKDKTLQISALRRGKANPKTDWRRAVNANRWFRLACETPLPEPASEKYEQIANPAVRLRQTLDVCPCDIRAFWAAKWSFRPQRHREREKARLAGGENRIRTRSCGSPDNRALFADKVRISPVRQPESPSRTIGQPARCRIVNAKQKVSSRAACTRIVWRADLTVPEAPICLALVVVDMQAQTGGSTRIESYSASRVSKYVPGEKNTGVTLRST